MKKNNATGNYLTEKVPIKHFLLIMRTTLILLFTCVFCSMAEISHTQNARVTINKRNVTLKEVLNEIENQTDYLFIYSNEVNTSEKVSLKAKQKAVSEVLDKLFKDKDVNYSMEGNHIILSTIERVNTPEKETIATVQQQKKTITGTVKDQNGEPIIGANIIEVGTTNGTVTDVDGNFSLSVEPDATIRISYLGYVDQDINTTGRISFNITLLEDIQALEEVVVVGYGTMTRKSITGSVTQVKAEELSMVNAVSVDNLLQGKAAGLVISQFTAQPGGDVSVNIRGGGTPLYVIDGVPLFSSGAVEASKIGPQNLENSANGSARSPLSSINPSDIETVDILKDAAATAIYGSAAANGVVLITTKKGKSGKVTVNYDGSVSMQKIAKRFDMLNGSDFRKYMDLARYEDWLSTNNYYPYGDIPAPSIGAPSRYFTDEEIANAPNYDHFDEISRTGIITDHNISISGGSNKSAYYASFNYFDQQSVLKTADFRRFSGRINLDQTFTDWLKLSISTMYTFTRTNNAQVGVSTDSRARRTYGNEAKMTGAALIFSPDRPLEQPDGSLTPNFSSTQVPNPLAFMAIRDMTDADRLFFAPNLEVKFTDYLKGNVVLGVDRTSADRDMWGPNRAKIPTQKEDNYGGFSKKYVNNYSLEGFLTFNKTFGTDHRLSAVLGGGYYRQDSKSYSLGAYNLSVEAVENYNLSLATEKELDIMNSWKDVFTKISQYARFNYTFKDRYIFGVTARRDGSDAFPPTKKYGFFPGLSLGWIISEESFMDDATWLDNLKLRMGYGTTGNDNYVKGNYYYLNQYATAYGMNYMIGGKLYSGVSQNIGKNENFVWQTDESLNAGIDFSIFRDRLAGSVDIYQRITKDLLGYTYPPITAPVAQRVTNVGSQRYKGIELSLNGDIIKKKDIVWSAYLNASHTKRTWIERDPTVIIRDWVDPKGEVNAYYGWKTDGIFQSREEVLAYVNQNGEMYQPTSHPGTNRYVDLNEDGVLNEEDVVYLGCWDPKVNFGFGTTLQYKGFDLSIGTYGVLGWMTTDSWMYTSLSDMRMQNQSVYLKEAWASYNPTGTRHGIKLDPSLSVPAGNDFTLQTSWYWRLKNITLGYTVPTQWLQKNKLIQKARIYLDAQNLGILTNYVGLDPEMEQNNASPFPIPFVISTGVNITF